MAFSARRNGLARLRTEIARDRARLAQLLAARRRLRREAATRAVRLALEHANWRIPEAAATLGLPPRVLRARIRTLGIQRPRRTAGPTDHVSRQDTANILVLTCDADLARVCHAALPFRVTEVCGSETIAVASALQPSVIVMDLCSPTDWEIVAELRKRRNTRHIPMVVLTGWISPERVYRQRARDLGCKAFVAKPCAPSVLAVTIGRVLAGETEIEVMRGGQAPS